MDHKLLELCLNEGWELNEKSNIVVNNQEYPIVHPYQIYLSIYKNSLIPIEKCHAMKKAHDFLWPHMIITNNQWQDDTFMAHCSNYAQIILSSGAGAGKSLNAAKIAVLFWLADPLNRAAVISSTTLDSLEGRAWGYAIQLLQEAALPIPFKDTSSKPPKVVFPGVKNKLAGLFAAAIREGSDVRTIGTAIGKHPRGGLLVVLDEATDITANFLGAIPNLEQGTPYFQLIALGNAKSKHDVHGGLATPRDGWDSVSPFTHKSWPTCRKDGVCLYFNPFESPAIKETDPDKKAALSKFLVTTEKINELKKMYGEDSDSFWRFCLGFWQQNAVEELIMTRQFLEESKVFSLPEWSGLRDLQVVAGLDPAISSGKKGCVLRFGIVGHTTRGQIVLDFREGNILHYIDIQPGIQTSPELQLADQVIYLLNKYNCPLYNLVIDATGLGRAVGELVKLRLKSDYDPIKMVWTRSVNAMKEKDPNLYTVSPLELWITMRNFIQHEQIKGLDTLTGEQLSNRKVIKDAKTGKQTLESKTDYKARMSAINPTLAHSPDEADSACLCLQGAIMRFGLQLGQRQNLHEEVDHFSEKYSAMLEERAIAEQQKRTYGNRQVASPRASFNSTLADFARSNRLRGV